MYTQSTPVHVSLWHKDFWLLALSNMLLSSSVYMSVPVLPLWCSRLTGGDTRCTAVLMAAYCLGLFSLIPFSSYIIQRRRRNNVCMASAALMAACMAAMFYLHDAAGMAPDVMFAVSAVLRFLLGAMFGLAHTVLASTLIIDKCESFLRTEANHAAAWFFRFSLSLGPLAALILCKASGTAAVFMASAACCLLAVLLIRLVTFPFKAPEENVHIVSLDRFFLPQGTRLFFNQMMIMVAVGLLLGMGHTAFFYGAMMPGFFMALLAQKYVFVNAELRSEILTGLLLIGCALMMSLFRDGGEAVRIVPVLTGLGVGLTGSRFLLFFLKLGNHCQRGTSQTTFFLSWESGLALGLAAGYLFGEESGGVRLCMALAFIAAAFVMYQFSTHSWYVRHKNR